MIFSLNLTHEITYKEEEINFSTIDDMAIGSETCFCYHFYFEDVFLKADLIWSILTYFEHQPTNPQKISNYCKSAYHVIQWAHS